MAKLNEKLLASYYDGALSPSKAKKVERLLESSHEDQEALNKMSRMSDLLQLMNEETLSDVSFAGFDKRVAIGIEQNVKQSFSERVKVYLSEFFDHRRVVWVPATAVAAIALAAVVAIPLVGGQQTETYVPDGEIRMANGYQSASAGSAIVSNTQGSKHDLDDGQGSTVGVVWIVE